ncbi:Hint domain-containing protein [Roseivivax lentus]|uniref:Hint domain-containing protein n=1 Tax=Roseivivax lentus TaxID=633194 RepID=A0A1N7KUA2_9RHOB|nr:Hint domain-containing protein [Roseivivax lentus]SIS65145.1 Hint domain-containing protein [Roseivivax lentus]
MGTGYRGTFVISWSQTGIDGLQAAPLASLTIGAAWSWHGEAVRVDGPNSLLMLDRADDDAFLRKRAARMVRKFVGAALIGARDPFEVEVDHPITDQSFVVTDGVKSFTVTVIHMGSDSPPLLMFVDDVPPRDTDLWLVHHNVDLTVTDPQSRLGSGVICFTKGTRIRVAHGSVAVEDLREGDMVQTKDNGLQEICWIGSRRMTGARLFALPALRPVRIRAGAFGVERPDEELLVSPQHRILFRGGAARSLFNTEEVLVSACDLVNDRSIIADGQVKEVTYIHLMLPRHEVLFANGVESESFHPGETQLDTLDPEDRARLRKLVPYVETNPMGYGATARRNLTASEAAILLHDAA